MPWRERLRTFVKRGASRTPSSPLLCLICYVSAVMATKLEARSERSLLLEEMQAVRRELAELRQGISGRGS
jgi:hypothetical protein